MITPHVVHVVDVVLVLELARAGLKTAGEISDAVRYRVAPRLCAAGKNLGGRAVDDVLDESTHTHAAGCKQGIGGFQSIKEQLGRLCLLAPCLAGFLLNRAPLSLTALAPYRGRVRMALAGWKPTLDVVVTLTVTVITVRPMWWWDWVGGFVCTTVRHRCGDWVGGFPS
jgi:hypothetical protein